MAPPPGSPPLALTIDGEPVVARSASGRSAVGELFRLTVVGAAPDGPSLLGKDFTLTFGELTLRGLVTAVEAELHDGEHAVALTLGPAVFVLTLGQGSRVFQKLSVVEIVKKVLETAGLQKDTRWATKLTYAPRVYTVQHRESDWAFIERLLAEEGIFYFFEHGDATTLVFADDSKASDTLGPVHHRMSFGVTTRELWVSQLSMRARVVHDSVAVRDRDHRKPDLKVEATAQAGKKTSLERYEWPGRVETKADATARAKRILEALQARAVEVTGQSGTTAVRPGRKLEVVDHSVESRNGELFVTAVDWTVALNGGSVEVRFSAIPAATPFRLPWREPARRPLGPEAATIVGAAGQEIDTDDSGRVVMLPTWDRLGKKDANASMRVRVGQPALVHSMLLPRTGWSVLFSHHDDDVDRPWAMGRLVDGAHPTAYKLPDDMTRSAWQTLTSPGDGTSNELRFEDKSGQEEIFLHASRDLHVDVGDNDAWTIGHSDTLDVGGNMTVKIGVDEKLTVSKDQTTTIKGKESLAVDGSRSVTVKGKEASSVGGSRTSKVTDDLTVDVLGTRSLTVGAVMRTTTDEGLKREVLKKRSATVGGAATTQTDQGLSVMVIGDTSETVAGAKTETGKAGVMTQVKGDVTETIAGAFVVSAKGSVGEAAKGKLTLQIGAALLATAPKIEIEGKSEITIVCGGSTLTIKSGSVEVKSPTIACAGPMITNTGATVKHNP